MSFLTIKINSNRIYGLDILRSLAIIFVVLAHGRDLLPDNHYISFFHMKFVLDGVSLFFVLSGFLVGGILIKLLEKNKPTFNLLINFWIRRWFRTIPNYIFILTILGLFYNFTIPGFSFFSIRRYFIFSQNIYSEHPWFFPEAWSLSVEEWFYLVIPLLIFFLIYFLKIQVKRSIFYISIILIVGVTMLRFFRFQTIEISTMDQWELLFRKQVITRLDGILFGLIGAYVQYYYKTFWIKYKNYFFLLGIIIFIATKTIELGGLYRCVFYFSALSIATLFILPLLSTLKRGSGFIYCTITRISLISYSMYLINFTLVRKIILVEIPWQQFSKDQNIIIGLKYLIFWTLTILGSTLIYKFIEIPTTNLRDYFNEK